MMFLNPGTWIVIAVAFVALIGVWQGDRALQRQKGAATAVAKMEKKANANAQKADAARRSVDKLPADGLLDKYTRD